MGYLFAFPNYLVTENPRLLFRLTSRIYSSFAGGFAALWRSAALRAKSPPTASSRVTPALSRSFALRFTPAVATDDEALVVVRGGVGPRLAPADDEDVEDDDDDEDDEVPVVDIGGFAPRLAPTSAAGNEVLAVTG